VVLLIGVAGAGCDTTVQRAPESSVRSFEVDFRMADAVQNGPVASVQFDAPEITPAVARRGAVMAYMREQGTWTALPYTYGVESPDLPAVDYTVTMGYAYDTDLFEAFYEVSDPQFLEGLPDRRIKVVVLEDRASTYDIDPRNYEAMAQRFGL
jgi:hypothetical protein